MFASEAMEAFFLSLRGSKSPATLVWYERRLRALVAFLGEVELGAVTVHDLRRWRAGLDARGLSVYTRHGYVRAARRFFRWCEDEELLACSPARRLELPRLPRGVVRGIAQEDLDRMLSAAASDPLDLALCWFFYSTACRLGGVVGLRIGDVDLARARAYVCEKGNRTRPVFLLPKAVEALRAWLAVRPDLPGDDHVFVGRVGGLTGSGVYQRLARIAARAGVEDGWNPHNWRHRRIRDLQAQGMPLGVASQVAGHSSVEVTANIYGSLGVEELQRAFDQFGTEGAK